MEEWRTEMMPGNINFRGQIGVLVQIWTPKRDPKLAPTAPGLATGKAEQRRIIAGTPKRVVPPEVMDESLLGGSPLPKDRDPAPEPAFPFIQYG
jgi:hypothetical protein